ncbi:MAG: glycosyltransferase family 4 protein [Candidatus Cloacimonetes bacterium]|nr:glycosyltransferase family 4 protein [Candidatus Cloacimonadota bacterium]
MYKILVSIMAYDNGQSGISDYINNVVYQLSKTNKLDLLILENDLEKFPVKNENINFIKVTHKLSKPIFNMLWHLFIVPFKYDLKKYDFAFLPAGNRRLFCHYPIFTITTFHDLSQFHIAQKYDRFRMFYIRKVIPFFLKKANRIIAVSQATKTDIIKFYKSDSAKITVAYNGYDKQKFNSDPSPKTRQEILNSSKKYILYVSRIEHPGKNHLNLLKAYELLPEAIKMEYNLVCAGGFKERSEEVLDYHKKSSDVANINFTGFFPAEDLVDLYKNASLFVMPSFYEGFGIPLVEAMACNIPVACSNRGPLPEVGGNAVSLFNPDEPKDICQKMINLLNDFQIREELIDNAKARLKFFQWQLHIEKIITLYEGRDEKL